MTEDEHVEAVIKQHLVYIVNCLRNDVPPRMIQQVTTAPLWLIERIARDAGIEIKKESL